MNNILDIWKNINKKFSILCSSWICFYPNHLINVKIDDIGNNIKFYGKSTGVLIDNFKTKENMTFYLFILDNTVLIIDQYFNQEIKNIYHEFLITNTRVFFLSNQLQNQFNQKFMKNNKDQEGEKKDDQIQFNSYNDFFEIQKKITYSIINKCYLRTIQFHNDENNTILSDLQNFIKIKDIVQKVSLYLNIKNQMMYILKYFTPMEQRKFDHENFFYKRIENQHPFISKHFGNIKKNQYNYIIIEYIDGDTLLNFIIKNKKNLSFYDKIKIIFEILTAVEFIHLNGIILRDFKYDNIMIDNNKNAFLIDFDNIQECSHLNDKSKEEPNVTGDIGAIHFMSPEQFKENKYSFKADMFSIGMIIHFILTEDEYIFKMDEFYDILSKTKQNILHLNGFAKLRPEYQNLFKYYESCLEYSPENRPNVSQVLNDLFYYILYFKSNNQMKSFLTKIFQLREKQLGLQLKKKMINIELYAVISYFIGYYYSNNDIINQNINNSIYYLKKSSENGNKDAAFHLSKIYFNGVSIPQNLNKFLKYLKQASDLNHQFAQYVLGLFYYQGILVQKDNNKAINYLNLSAMPNNYKAIHLLCIIYYSMNSPKYEIYLYFNILHKYHETQFLYGKLLYEKQDISKSIFYLTQSTNQNNSDAQCLLGKIYYEGKYIKSDVKKAISYLKLSSKQNNSNALYYLGLIYYEGIYIDRNIESSKNYLIQSCNLDNSLASYQLGVMYFENKYIKRDINQSIFYLQKAVHAENKYAEYLLGIIYYYYKKDIGNSLKYLNLSANKNYPKAQCLLGHIYYHAKDINKSIYYFQKASDNGFTLANCYLYIIYSKDKSVLQDKKHPFDYLQLALDQKHPYAQLLYSKILFEDKQNPQNIDECIHYLKLASNTNDEAMFLLGWIYLKVKEDIKEAIKNLKKSSAKGNSEAQYILGKIYIEGKKIERNTESAIEYLESASKKGNSKASYLLGEIYLEGKFVEKNYKKAIGYIKQSSNKNDCRAKIILGIMHKKGYGTQKSINKAEEDLINAYRLGNEQTYPYISYNLAILYYFEYNNENDIEKIINYLRESANYNFLPAYLFLLFIFSFDERSSKYKNERLLYFSLLDEKLGSFIIKDLEYTKDPENIQRLKDFFRDYDITYSSRLLNSDFDEVFVDNLIYYIQNKSFKKEVPLISTFNTTNHNINKFFYDGFEIDIF